MVINRIPENATNVVEHEVSGSVLDFEDGELTIKLNKRERDDPVHLDICRDYMGGLVMGTGSTARSYVAQIDIPARRYEEVEGDGEEGTTLVPVPFDVDLCTLTLWEMED